MKPDILDSGFIGHLVNHGIPCLVTLPSLVPQGSAGSRTDRRMLNRVRVPGEEEPTASTLRLEVVGQTTQNHELVQL